MQSTSKPKILVVDDRPDIPIILASGFSDSTSPDIAKQAGVYDSIMKPIDIPKLAKTIQGALEIRNSKLVEA